MSYIFEFIKKPNFSNIFLTIVLFCLIRVIDANVLFIGFFFIFSSLILIYTQQKILNKSLIYFLTFLLFSLIIFNEKKEIHEISSPLKISKSSDDFYFKVFGEDKYKAIKKHYLENEQKCNNSKKGCFSFNFIEDEITLSVDQIFFNVNRDYSRKVNKIKFNNLVEHRASFTNTYSGRLKYGEDIYKLDTPYIVKYNNLDSIDIICTKGFVILGYYDGTNKTFNNSELKCVQNNSDLKNLIGLNYENNNLKLLSKKNGIAQYFDELILILFFISLVCNIYFQNFKKDLKLLLPITISILIIFYISRYDLWFHVFNLFSLYFFGFVGGDGLTYTEFAHEIYKNFIDLNFINVFRGGEDNFQFTPGFRYFLFLNHLISGDFYYLYFFILFFLPKIIYKFLCYQFNEKIGYIFTLSFLLFPLLHHLGFSYYQYIRHAYRLFPESLAYMIFIYALFLFYSNFKNKYLYMNFLFALSVFLRPNLVITVFVIVLLKTIHERINIFKFNYFIILLAISLIYLFPLIHNYYFANAFTLFTKYGAEILSLENIMSKNTSFYVEKFLSINSLFIFLLFYTKGDKYLKLIMATQYFTIFYFDNNGRYYWIYWFASLILISKIFIDLKLYKWEHIRKFITK